MFEHIVLTHVLAYVHLYHMQEHVVELLLCNAQPYVQADCGHYRCICASLYY